MKRTTVEELDSRAFRGIELLVVGTLAINGIFGVGILVFGLGSGAGGEAIGTGWAGIAGVGYLLLLAFGAVSYLATPLLLYLDAQKIRAADVDWDPSPAFSVVGALFLGTFMQLHHLYKRHQVVVDWVDRTDWRYLVVAGAVGPLFFAVATVALAFVLSGSQLSYALVPAGLGLLTAALFPLGVYRDATYVRLNSGAWQPNPGSHLGWAFIGLYVAPLWYPLHGGYYLYKRRQALA